MMPDSLDLPSVTGHSAAVAEWRPPTVEAGPEAQRRQFYFIACSCGHYFRSTARWRARAAFIQHVRRMQDGQ